MTSSSWKYSVGQALSIFESLADKHVCICLGEEAVDPLSIVEAHLQDSAVGWGETKLSQHFSFRLQHLQVTLLAMISTSAQQQLCPQLGAFTFYF